MTRILYEEELRKLRDDILVMGSQIEEQLRLSLTAFETLNSELGERVTAFDTIIDKTRFEIEERCFMLIVTQQPLARDLRLIYAAANMIVDLERMGDQTKGIVKVIPRLQKMPTVRRPVELRQMGDIGGQMLHQAMQAYADGDVELARKVISRDDEVDALHAQVYTQIMQQLAESQSAEQAEAISLLLRVARELERFADLVTNVSERSIYLVTGSHPDARLD